MNKVMTMGCAALTALCGLLTAQADVFAEAKYLWVFGEDLNGDGEVQANEVRDLRHWDTYTQLPQASNFTGNDLQAKGPTWVTTKIAWPGQGISYTGTAMRFTVDNRATNEVDASGMVKTNCCPVGFVFNNASITGSVTVLMRMRADSFNSYDGFIDHAWLVNNGEAWSANAGSNFGFYPTYNHNGNTATAYPSVFFGKKELQGSSIKLSTNVWYDVGIALRDTGDGGAEALFVVYDEGLDRAYTSTKELKRAHQGLQIEQKTLAAGSGAFQNESAHSSYIRIGTESFGRGYRSANKGFAGDVHRIAMWARALTTNELIEAICAPSPLVRIGVENGSSEEFGARDDLASEAVYTAGLPGQPWHELPSSVDADHPELAFTVTLPGSECHLLGQTLRVRAAAGATGVTWLRPTVNGRALEAKSLTSGGEAIWFLKTGGLQAGANTIALTRLATSTAASLAFDVIDVGGSWRLGKADSSNSEFSIEYAMRVPYTHYVGNWTFANIQRGLPTTFPKVTLRFFVEERFALRHDHVFSGRVTTQGSSNADHWAQTYGIPKNQYPFRILLNGEPIYETGDAGLPSGTNYSTVLPAGTLNAGWNEIVLENLGKPYTYTNANGDSTGNNCWLCFDHHTLEVKPIPDGTVLFLR